VWAESYTDDDTDLKSLAEELPEIIFQSRADSTVRSYAGAFRRWKDWAQKYRKPVIPAVAFDVSLYLVHISHSCKSPAPIIKAVSAISWAHKLAGAIDPNLSNIVKSTSEGLKRKLCKPINKKEPITADILKQIVDLHIGHAGMNQCNLLNIRTVTMCLVAYAGFLRFDELANIKLKHLTFTDSGMDILIPSS
jgi:hypothetical protein